jgi:uncharacterized membrane-anchored protein YjiN (DUF445 family)
MAGVRSRPPAARLHAIASGLLLLMGGLLAFSTWAIGAIHPGFSWVQAFAEAALVGGLADWFAVTALFRRPLGLPIPHTAIIPHSKDRIGDALARFFRTNFLNPRTVARRLEGFSAAAALVGWLNRPGSESRLRQSMVRLVRELAASPAGTTLLGRLHRAAMRRAADVEVAPLAGRLLESVLESGRHQPLVDRAIAWTADTLDSNQQLIRDMVEQRTTWLLRMLKLDDRLSTAILDGLRGMLGEIAADPAHPVRLRADAALRALARDLQTDGSTRAAVERAKRQFLRHPAVDRWVESMWAEMRQRSFSWLEGEAIGSVGRAIGDALAVNPALSRAFDQIVRRAIVAIAADHGDALVRLVSDTIRSWDTKTVTERLETAVSRDLQYIRFNGTLIGGLIGLCLHAVLSLA